MRRKIVVQTRWTLRRTEGGYKIPQENNDRGQSYWLFRASEAVIRERGIDKYGYRDPMSAGPDDKEPCSGAGGSI